MTDTPRPTPADLQTWREDAEWAIEFTYGAGKDRRILALLDALTDCEAQRDNAEAATQEARNRLADGYRVMKAEGEKWRDALTERADLQAENARLTAALRPLALYRCRGCGARWLFWGGDIAGLQAGTWNLLDQWQCPGECCDNAPMGEQMEFVRDIVARAALAPATPPATETGGKCFACWHPFSDHAGAGCLGCTCQQFVQVVLATPTEGPTPTGADKSW